MKPQHKWYHIEDIFLIKENYGLIYFKIGLLNRKRWKLDLMLRSGFRITSDIMEGNTTEDTMKLIYSQLILSGPRNEDRIDSITEIVEGTLLDWSNGMPFDFSTMPSVKNVDRAIFIIQMTKLNLLDIPFHTIESVLKEYYTEIAV